MDTPSLRRRSTLPIKDSSDTPPERKILKPKRTLSRTPTTSKFSKAPSLTRKATIAKETKNISTAVISLESGAHIGKTGSLKNDDVGPDVEVTMIDVPSKFSETGSAVVTSLKKTLSQTGSMSKRLTRKETSMTALPMPPGELVEIAFSFDTTGSMYAALDEVKGRIKDIVQKLQSDVAGLRIAIFAHGDYCDHKKYVIKWIDFGATIPELHDFVNSCESTWGGDGPECYELVLRRAQEVLSWTPGSRRSLVIIGDNLPHEPGYRYDDFINDIDWRVECTKLKDMGVRVYGVAVMAGVDQLEFYQEIAKRTDGLMITLDKFDLIFDLIMAICYREGGDELLSAYQDELKEKYGVSKLQKNLSGMFAGLAAAPGTRTFPVSPLFGTGIQFKTAGTPFGTTGAPFGTTGTPLATIGAPLGTPTTPSMGTIGPLIGVGTPPFGKGLNFGTGTLPAITPLRPVLGAGLAGIPPTIGLGNPFGIPPTIGAGSPFGIPPLTGFFGRKNAKGVIKRLKTGAQVSTSTTKRKKNVKPAKPREEVNDKKFKETKPLDKLDWSNWKLMASPNNTKKDSKRCKWLNGYTVNQDFRKDMDKPAVIEFGIQPPTQKKTYPVDFKVVENQPFTEDWGAKLVGRKDIKDKFKRAISQGATLWVRRALFRNRNKKSIENVREHLINSNYAFGTSKKNSRTLKLRKGFSV